MDLVALFARFQIPIPEPKYSISEFRFPVFRFQLPDFDLQMPTLTLDLSTIQMVTLFVAVSLLWMVGNVVLLRSRQEVWE
jgi:hypothetical protein